MIKMKGNNNWKVKPQSAIALSILSAILISIVSYFQNNIAYALFDDIDHISKLEYIKRQLYNIQRNDSDVLFVNIAYDKKLIAYNNAEFGFPEGNIDVTDRSKLYKFLHLARKANNYKFIFLDVRFEKGYEDNDTIIGKTIDEALYNEISLSPRIVLSNHSDILLADSALAEKAALNDYYTTITSTNLVRYQYLADDNKESVALRMYKDLNGKSISKHGPIYTSDGKLCYNSPFLRITHDFPSKFDENGNLNYYNLGVDILDVFSEKEIIDILKNKIIIIGDFVEDIHDTYVGSLPGSYITYNAYISLVKGKHLVNWYFVFVSFLLYVVISISMFYKKSIIEYIPYLKTHQSGFLCFLFSLIGYSAIILIVSDIFYLCLGETSSIWFPSLFFSIGSTILKYIRR